MLYGSRERTSGRQSTRMGNSSGAACAQQPLYQPCFSSTPHCFHTYLLGPLHWKGSGKKGNSQKPYCWSISRRTSGVQDSLPGIAQMQLHRQKQPFCRQSFPSLQCLLRGRCTHNFSAHIRHLLMCSLPEESRTGSFSLVQDSLPLASNLERNSLQSSCGRRAEVRAPCPPCLTDSFLETWGFLPGKHWNITNTSQESLGVDERRGCAVPDT